MILNKGAQRTVVFSYQADASEFLAQIFQKMPWYTVPTQRHSYGLCTVCAETTMVIEETDPVIILPLFSQDQCIEDYINSLYGVTQFPRSQYNCSSFTCDPFQTTSVYHPGTFFLINKGHKHIIDVFNEPSELVIQ
jgi:hypothetical protein